VPGAVGLDHVKKRVSSIPSKLGDCFRSAKKGGGNASDRMKEEWSLKTRKPLSKTLLIVKSSHDVSISNRSSKNKDGPIGSRRRTEGDN